MNLTFIDYNKNKDKRRIKEIYLNSFPKDERLPFWLLAKCAKEDNISFDVIYNDKTVIGFQYIVNCDEISYLMYLAVDGNNRNKGYGSEILKQLEKQNKNILLSIEKPMHKKDMAYNRKQFYLRNGFKSTNRFLVDNDVKYELLCNNNNINVDTKLMEKRYTNMSSSKFIRYIISRMFNVYDISLK